MRLRTHSTKRSPNGQTFRSLRNRNYRLYFLGQAISTSGTWVQLVAENWLEGVVMKRRASLYRPGFRSPDWIKVPVLNREEFVVADHPPGTPGGTAKDLPEGCSTRPATASGRCVIPTRAATVLKGWEGRRYVLPSLSRHSP